MWSRHGRAAEVCIRTIACVGRRAGASAGRADVGFDATASIAYNRPAAAKASNGIGASYQGSCRISGGVDSRRILHRGTIRTRVLRGGYHHDTSHSLRFHGSLQGTSRTTFRRRALPGIISDVRRFGRVGITAANPGRSEEPLHALDVSGGCAVTLIHVAATNPLCTGRHTDLVTHAVITDHRTGGVRTMSAIIAWERRVRTANATASMYRVVPIVIMIGNHAVPTTVMRLKRVMRPAHACVGTRHHNVLSSETQCPYLGSVHVIDAGFNRRRPLHVRRRLFNSLWLRQMILNVRVAFYPGHLRPGRQCLGNIARAFYQNCVHNVEGLMLESAFTQPLQEWALRGQTLI